MPTATRSAATPLSTRASDPTRTLTRVSTATLTPAFTPTRTPTPWPSPSGRSECTPQRFFSATLGEAISFFVYLPVGYLEQTPRRYPVVYLLSGLGATMYEWPTYGACTQMDQLLQTGRVQPMIIVMPAGNDNPAGGVGSFWFNHAPAPVGDGKRWGDFIWKDLVNYIDSSYRTIPHRASRAIGGLSAGGQGALTLALTHPEVFAIAGAHSPSFRRADGSVAAFGDPTYYNQYDPIWLAQNTQTWKELTIWLDGGISDTQWGDALVGYHDLLTALSVPHAWNRFPGAHEPAYWIALTPTYLDWYSSQLMGQWCDHSACVLHWG